MAKWAEGARDVCVFPLSLPLVLIIPLYLSAPPGPSAKCCLLHFSPFAMTKLCIFGFCQSGRMVGESGRVSSQSLIAPLDLGRHFWAKKRRKSMSRGNGPNWQRTKYLAKGTKGEEKEEERGEGGRRRRKNPFHFWKSWKGNDDREQNWT